jgi:hypothetical protein
MSLDYTTLAVGQEVAVSRGSNRRIYHEGVYTVVKVDKLRAVLERNSDGLTREFSIKRGVELSTSPFIESVEKMQQRQARHAAERGLQQTWADAEQAARNKDLTALMDIVAKLSQPAV